MAKAEKKQSKKSSSKIDDLSVNTENGAAQLLTTNQGLKINDNNNSLKAGERGPTLLEDFILREKITHFDHERIPEMIEAGVITDGNAHKFIECIARHRFWNREEFRKVPA